MVKDNICSICNKQIEEWPNSSQITGKLICDKCNDSYEIAYRMAQMSQSARKFLIDTINDHGEDEIAKNLYSGVLALDVINKGKDW